MESIEPIITAISTVGYPIVMSLLMFWYVKFQNENHKKEIDDLKTAINNNTLVIQKLIDRCELKNEKQE